MESDRLAQADDLRGYEAHNLLVLTPTWLYEM